MWMVTVCQRGSSVLCLLRLSGLAEGAGSSAYVNVSALRNALINHGMASPARGMKRFRRGKEKVARDPPLEDDEVAELRDDDDDDRNNGRQSGRRKPARNVAGRHDAGWPCFEIHITASQLNVTTT